MLRALIFDFDGIIVDSEPTILKLTQEMAAREGWTITPEEYYHDYLALDDRGIIEHLYRSHGRPVDRARRDELAAWKARTYRKIIGDGLPAFPGAIEFIKHAAAQFPLAIASGSLRSEVEHLLAKLRVREQFQVVATAEDSERPKPHPGVYLKALERLRRLDGFRDNLLTAASCLAIEDAPGGIEAAHAAGMRCLALTHSRPAAELRHADWVLNGFSEVDLAKTAAEFRP